VAAGPPRAKPNDLNQVNRALMHLHEWERPLRNRLGLSDAHRQHHRARGLTDDQIDRYGYRSAPSEG
jgi:hypothetical protein